MKRPPITIYFIMVNTPHRGWLRVGTYYRSKENAKGWVSFVKKAWCGCQTRVRECKITFREDGCVDDRSRQRLDAVFNCDVTARGSTTPRPQMIAEDCRR